MKISPFFSRRTAAAWGASLAVHGLVVLSWWPAAPSREATEPAHSVITVRLDPTGTVPVPVSPNPRRDVPDAKLPEKHAEAVEPTPAPAVPPSLATGMSEPASAAHARVDPFLRVGDLTRLPRLPGEPLIDLGAEALPDGELSLRMWIDARGHVVAHRVEDVSRLSDEVAERLRSAFIGYTYLPAESAGRPVACEVVLRLAVRDGAATALGVR